MTSKKQKSTEQNIVEYTQILFEIGAIINDFQEESDEILKKKILAMTDSLKAIQSSASQFKDVKLPIDVLRFIDDGKNPEAFLAESAELAVAKNQSMRGKIECLQKFKSDLWAELDNVVPAEFRPES